MGLGAVGSRRVRSVVGRRRNGAGSAVVRGGLRGTLPHFRDVGGAGDVRDQSWIVGSPQRRGHGDDVEAIVAVEILIAEGSIAGTFAADGAAAGGVPGAQPGVPDRIADVAIGLA